MPKPNKTGMHEHVKLVTLPAAMKLAERYGVDMPIIAAVNSVVNEGADPAQTVRLLMARDRKTELPKSFLDINFENTI